MKISEASDLNFLIMFEYLSLSDRHNLLNGALERYGDEGIRCDWYLSGMFHIIEIKSCRNLSEQI